MKKFLSLTLCVMLLVLSVASCGGSSNANADASAAPAQSESAEKPSEAKLTFSWWGNQVRNERTQQVLDLYSSQNPGITFDPQFAPWADYWTKTATSAAGHNLPDIIQMDYSYLEQYVANDLLVDLKPYVASGDLDVSNVNEDILNSGSVNDGLFAIPIGVNTATLAYNKTLLDGAGIEVKDYMNMDEFMALCKEIYEKTGYKTNFGYNIGVSHIEFLLRADGNTFIDGNKLGVDSPRDLDKFFSYYEKGIKEGWMLPAEVFAEISIGSMEQDPMLYGSSTENMSWCSLVWTNLMTALQASAPEGVEIGMATWPTDNVDKSYYLKPSQFLSVTVDSKNPAESAKVLDYFTNSVDCNNILLAERGVPVSEVVATEISANLDEGNQKSIKFINEVVAPRSSAISPPTGEGSGEVTALLNKLQEQLCYGQITATEASDTLFTEGNKILASK